MLPNSPSIDISLVLTLFKLFFLLVSSEFFLPVSFSLILFFLSGWSMYPYFKDLLILSRLSLVRDV
nr:MAG TPA: hypothetical protein [Bacteriophage sp.]DAV60097.1 MAG TPA: hypothetical protein [Caudoviricetes sp.]